MFQELMASIWEEFIRVIFHVEVNIEPAAQESVYGEQRAPTNVQLQGGGEEQPSALREAQAAGAGRRRRHRRRGGRIGGRRPRCRDSRGRTTAAARAAASTRRPSSRPSRRRSAATIPAGAGRARSTRSATAPEAPESLASRLGFAVKVLGEGGLPSHDTRRWQSGPHLSNSLVKLEAILGYCDRHDIRMYRVATALAPYSSHPELTQFHGQVEECEAELERVGARALELGIRLSTHPGQYTVLNSESDSVRDAAAAELEVQAALFDAMGLGPESVVVLHVGGSAGGIDAGLARFEAGFELLSDAARSRLVIENDDRVFAIGDVAGLAGRLGIPAVFDPHHHRCHDPDRIADSEALALALATWRAGVTPKIHFSSPRLDIGEERKKVGRRVERRPVLPQLRAHADLIDPMAFEHYLVDVIGDRDLDVMLEAKAKDLALTRLREQLVERGHLWSDGRLTAARRG